MGTFDEDFPPLDIAECLMSEEAIAGYLRLSLEEDTPEQFARSLAVAARARAMLSKNSQTGENAPSARDWFNSIGIHFSFTPAATAAAVA